MTAACPKLAPPPNVQLERDPLGGDMAEDAEAIVTGMLNIPKFAVSGFNVSISSTEAIIVASSLMPGLDAKGDMAIGQRPEVVVSMSPQSVKELHIVLGGLVAQYETDHGTIRTPFIDERTKA